MSNDNFSNATAISVNEWLSGSNAGATGEKGEPVNNGQTVWWVWTCPISVPIGTILGLTETGSGPPGGPPTYEGDSITGTPVVVSTRLSDALAVSSRYGIAPPVLLPGQTYQPPITAVSPTNFYSKVQVFTANNPSAPTVDALTEVNYTTQGNGAYLGLNYEYADSVAWNAIPGTTYYIRVDSRLNDPKNNGWILLSLFQCIGCQPMKDIFYTTIDNINAGPDQIAYFNGGQNFPAGKYRIKYCSGCIYMPCPPGTVAAITDWQGLEDENPDNPNDMTIVGRWNDTGASASESRFTNGDSSMGWGNVGLQENSDGTVDTVSGYQRALEYGLTAPIYLDITHTGGAIGIHYRNSWYKNDVNGSGGVPAVTNPIFAICAAPQCQTGCGSVAIGGARLVCAPGGYALEVEVDSKEYNVQPYQLSVVNPSGFQSLATAVDIFPNFGKNLFYLPIQPQFSANTTQSVATIVLTSPTQPGAGTVCGEFAVSAPITLGLAQDGASFNRANEVYTGYFQIASTETCAVSGCTVTLQATGGVTHPSGPVQNVSFTPGSPTQVNFTFDSVVPDPEQVEATLVITQDGTFIAQLTFAIGVVLAVTGQSSPGSYGYYGNCPGSAPNFPEGTQSFTITNTGFVNTYPINFSVVSGTVISMPTNGLSVTAGGSVTFDFNPCCDTTIFQLSEVTPAGMVNVEQIAISFGCPPPVGPGK